MMWMQTYEQWNFGHAVTAVQLIPNTTFRSDHALNDIEYTTLGYCTSTVYLDWEIRPIECSFACVVGAWHEDDNKEGLTEKQPLIQFVHM